MYIIVVGWVSGHGDLDGLFARLSIASAVPTIFLDESEQQLDYRQVYGWMEPRRNLDRQRDGRE
jgi:hypothetical protein